MASGSDSGLSIVPDDAPSTAPPPHRVRAGGVEAPVRPRTERILAGALVVGLVLAAWAATTQYRRAESLAERVGSLKAELLETNEKLTAYRLRWAEVQTAVGDLGGLFDRLRGLVDRDPLMPPTPVASPHGDSPKIAPVAQGARKQD